MRPRPLVLALVVVAALVAPAAAESAEPALAGLRGPWAGTLIGAEPPIAVSVRLSGGKRGSTIAFSGGIDCNGVLLYTGRADGGFRFSERIRASATDRCGGLGAVRLRLRADGRLDYRWRAVGEDIPPARAVLERVVLGG